jgi:hypothetical protein
MNYARWSLQSAPWFFGGFVVVVLLTCFWGIGPIAYLLWSSALGALWFALLVLAWRLRSDLLRLGSFMVVGYLGLHFLKDHFLSPGQYCESLQGGFLICAVATGLMWVLRGPVSKFAKLEEPSNGA